MLLFAFALAAAPDSEYWGNYREPYPIKGGGVLASAKRIGNIPSEISRQFRGKSISVFSVDINSDGKDDYVTHENNAFHTCYIDSSFQLKSCETRGYMDGFSYRWFAQLDDDPMLELITVDGDQDGAAYRIYKFDPKTWKPKFLLEFNPVIIANDKDHKGVYWGYAWDIHDLIIVRTGKAIKLPATFDHTFGKDALEHEPERKSYPVMYFAGTPTQGEATGPFANLSGKKTYYTLAQLTKRANEVRPPGESKTH